MTEGCATWHELLKRARRDAALGALGAGRYWKNLAAEHLATCDDANPTSTDTVLGDPSLIQVAAGMSPEESPETTNQCQQCDWRTQSDGSQLCPRCHTTRYPTRSSLLAP
ncbi:hypothetical protein [Streptomyces sp. NPDC048644]|uniref:hypothetical protein n=1 Tax=Streptomyces sp. NPDC048644 TaxID=3365582 RepID=UPI003719FD7C